MKKESFSLLLALFVLLTSCRTVDYSTDGSITIRYEFINDTDYVIMEDLLILIKIPIMLIKIIILKEFTFHKM